MDADFSVEFGGEAAALELPWRDAEGRLQYVELRGNAAAVEQIAEARQFPALRRLLTEINAETSAWMTAKCDVWAERAEAGENLYGAAFVQGCYVDVVLAGEAERLRESLTVHENAARRIARQMEEDEELEASAEIVVRRCYFHRNALHCNATEGEAMEESDAGCCLTLFLSGFGRTAEEAAERWTRALEVAGKCLRETRLEEERAKG